LTRARETELAAGRNDLQRVSARKINDTRRGNTSQISGEGVDGEGADGEGTEGEGVMQEGEGVGGLEGEGVRRKGSNKEPIRSVYDLKPKRNPKAPQIFSLHIIEERVQQILNTDEEDIEAVLVALNTGELQADNSKELEAERIASIESELKQMITYNVWKPVNEVPEGADVIPSKIFTVMKYGAQGQFLKYKSRLVAGGHKEVLPFWVDTSSPTVRFETLLICFCIAAHLGLEMSTGDVGGAFLEALMDRPDVFVRLDKEVASVLIKKYQEYKKYKKTDGSIVVNLKKAMYGLK